MKLFKPKEGKRYVIVDVDPGCDDAWAILLLLKAMECELCEILAITCTTGNTSVEQAAINALRVLKTVGKERDIPVYKGAVKELIHTENIENFHGANGFQDIELPDDVDTSLIQTKHAINAIHDLVIEYPNQVTMICLGPLTNLAIALRMYGDLATNIKEVFIMGGNYMGIGNITKSAEFNFYMDAESAYIVLDTMKCPITILPWEACTIPNVQITFDWRREVLGQIDNAITRLMNPIEYKAYKKFKVYANCDALLAACFICPDMIKVANEWHATVELNGRSTRGQLVLDHLKSNKHNSVIIEKTHTEILQTLMLWTCGEKVDIEIV